MSTPETVSPAAMKAATETGSVPEIRELVLGKQRGPEYLVLLVCAKHFRMFKGSGKALTEIKAPVPDHVAAYKNDVPERVTNFSDVSDRKEIMLDKFLHQADVALTRVLTDHPLPVVVVGAARTGGHFRKLSHNLKHIVEFIHGNHDEATIPELVALLAPSVADLEKTRQHELIKQLDAAMDAHKLALGIHEVWRYAMQDKGRSLVVEEGYFYPSDENGVPVLSHTHEEKPYYLKDAVDIVIERVLGSGGKVAFVDKGLLDRFNHIALVQHY